MGYQVYILQSMLNGRYCVGQTADLGDRLDRHNAGREKATAPHVPWMLVWATSKETRSEAVLLERKLKYLSRIRLEAFMRKYGVG
jgi:putative endonuclease